MAKVGDVQRDRGRRIRAMSRPSPVVLGSGRRTVAGGADRRVDLHELQIVYQPIVSIGDHSVVGFEALVRWVFDGGELLAPPDMTPIADSSGRVRVLGQWVLERACRHLASWQTKSGMSALFVSVDLSGLELNARLPVMVQSAVFGAGVSPSCLHVGVNAASLNRDVQLGIEVLNDLRSIGVKTALRKVSAVRDGLTQFPQLPVDAIVVDRILIRGFGDDDAGDTGTVATLVGIAHACGAAVVAEGVDTDAQLASLYRVGCDTAQGHAIAPPMSESNVAGFLLDLRRHRQPELTGAQTRPHLLLTGGLATTTHADSLTERQREIVERLLLGERVPTIARNLFLSQSTVRNHLSVIFRKFDVGSQEELLLAVRRAELASSEVR